MFIGKILNVYVIYSLFSPIIFTSPREIYIYFRRHDRLEWLSTLTLTSNKITNLTISYSAIRAMFPSLTVLDISDNLISNLPKELSLFSNLSVLNLSGNKDIKELPPELGMLSRFENFGKNTFCES